MIASLLCYCGVHYSTSMILAIACIHNPSVLLNTATYSSPLDPVSHPLDDVEENVYNTFYTMMYKLSIQYGVQRQPEG
jgi:hypothetical protein